MLQVFRSRRLMKLSFFVLVNGCCEFLVLEETMSEYISEFC